MLTKNIIIMFSLFDTTLLSSSRKITYDETRYNSITAGVYFVAIINIYIIV